MPKYTDYVKMALLEKKNQPTQVMGQVILCGFWLNIPVLKAGGHHVKSHFFGLPSSKSQLLIATLLPIPTI